jgi:beta-glucosidase
VAGNTDVYVWPQPERLTAMGWRVEFEAFTELFELVAHDYPAGPILITENGAAFHDEVAEDAKWTTAPRSTTSGD